VRAVEKITKGIGREDGLGEELLGHFGMNSNAVNGIGKETDSSSPKMNGTLH
jgi:hypothetical protein